MIRELLRRAYWKGAERECAIAMRGYAKIEHLPPDVLRIDTLDIDQFPSFQQVELQPYHLDLDASTNVIAVYRLSK